MKTIRKRFTLVELISSMAIFSMLMLMLMQIFSSTQNTTAKAMTKTATYASARLFLDMLTTDLQNAVYQDTLRGFQRTFAVRTNVSNTDTNYTRADYLWMVTSKPYSLSGFAKDSKQCEVKYTRLAVSSTGTAKDFRPYRIKYEILPEYSGSNTSPVHNADFDFRNTGTSDHPCTTMTDADTKKSFILDNVVELKINRAFLMSSGTFSWKETWTGSDTGINDLPNMLLITLSVIDPENLTAYEKAASGEKDKFLRKFTRVVSINRNQSYGSTLP